MPEADYCDIKAHYHDNFLGNCGVDCQEEPELKRLAAVLNDRMGHTIFMESRVAQAHEWFGQRRGIYAMHPFDIEDLRKLAGDE
jgi:hypothetical protein